MDYKVHIIALAAITATFIAIAIPTLLGGLLAGAVLGMGSFLPCKKSLRQLSMLQRHQQLLTSRPPHKPLNPSTH